MYRILKISCIIFLVFYSLSVAQNDGYKFNVDWKSFLSNQDMVWKDKLPNDWTNGPFLGNGMLGSMVYYMPDSNAIRFEMCRSDYEDHRDSTQGETPYRKGRLPIGYFLLKPVGKIITQSNMRLDLRNAELNAKIVTDKGNIIFKFYVHTKEMLIIVETNTTGEEEKFKWEWKALPAVSPRQQWGIANNEPNRIFMDYKANPDPIISKIDGIKYCEQKLLFGGQTTTAWKELINGSKRNFLINITHSYPSNTSTLDAVKYLNSFTTLDFQKLSTQHKTWWNKYYQRSFVSLPDAKLESFYWIQMYKLASATRADRALIDNQGPWLEKSAWPYATWNLNVQLTYWPVYTSNRLEIGESLLNTLWKNRENLRKNIPLQYQKDSYGIGRATGTDCVAKVGIPGLEGKGTWIENQQNIPEVGLLTWSCHNLWLQYRHSMNKEMLREKLYPLLKGAINYYLYFLIVDEKGKLHLPLTYSPEYKKMAEDCNFDLSLLKWGCRTLIKITEELSINDSQTEKWKNVVENLTDYPSDENGFMIGKDVPYDKSHRHYSHLLMIYPLYEVNVEQVGGVEIIEKSLKHWQSLSEQMRGFSYTGAASIAASLGKGNEALSYLKDLWEEKFLCANTFYVESGPVIETPLSGAQAIHDMLIQSWGDKIRIFPAIPNKWYDVSFDNLSAEGGFLVSASRKNGKTEFVKIENRAGELCIINPNIEGEVQIKSTGNVKLEKSQNGFYKLKIKKGESVILYESSTKDFLVRPINVDKEKNNYFGSEAMKQITNQ